MKSFLILGIGLVPFIRNDNTKEAIEPVHETEFPLLPIKARNEFKKISTENKNSSEGIPTWPDYIGQNLDVLV